jgi:hypothetical protein
MGVDSNSAIAWQHTNGYATGKLIATYDDNGLHFYLNDPLGTRRAKPIMLGCWKRHAPACLSVTTWHAPAHSNTPPKNATKNQETITSTQDLSE